MLKRDILNFFNFQHRCSFLILITIDVKRCNTTSAVIWESVHEHIVGDTFCSNQSSSANLFMNSKLCKIDAFGVENQLLLVTAKEIYMRTHAVRAN